MGNRSGGQSASPLGLARRYRGVLFSVLFVGVMLTGAVAGATALDGQAAPADSQSVAAQADSTEIGSCTVIDEPGRYELTADVAAADEGEACLQVKSDDVRIDGNGYAVSGGGPESGVGVLVFNGSRSGYPRDGPALTNVTVRDLRVSEWGQGVQAGVELREGPSVTLRNVTAADNGRGVTLSGNQESRLTNVTVTDNDRVGLALWGTTNVTGDGITATDNGASGVSFSDTVVGSAFTDVTAAGNAGHGIHLSTGARNNTVSDADVRNNDGAGVAFIDSVDNEVRDSVVTGNAGPGILADPSDGDRVSNVTVSDNEIAYRNGFAGARYGAIADHLRLDSGVEASFDRNVSSFDEATDYPEPPRDVRTAGPAANVTLSDEAAADSRTEVTIPYAREAVGDESGIDVLRYGDGNWHSVANTSVDADDRTVTATVGESGVLVPVYGNQIAPVAGNRSTFVVNATDAETPVVYGFVVDGRVFPASVAALPAEDGEDLVERRSSGGAVVLGTTGDDGGDTFRVTGEVTTFATQPENASVRLELDGEDVTDRLTRDDDAQ